jgi:hypothetical protein
MSKIALDSGEALATDGGLEICYRTFGRPSDRPLLLIAGLGAQMILWEDDFCEALAARHRRNRGDRAIASRAAIPRIRVPSGVAAKGLDPVHPNGI